MIQRLGPNPYVDVPARLSRAFAPHARAGRIAVRGTLNATPFRATLIPARRGRHRLFVNGGLRAAAGVAVGDTVFVSLRPTRPDAVPLPRDLASALRREPGAGAAFGALSAAYRLQLLRHVDDARTPATRRRRIAEVTAHALERGAPSPRPGARAPARRAPDALGAAPAADRDVPPRLQAMRRRPLWMCPRCGAGFVNRNQWHSCRRQRLDDLFAGKPSHVRALFDRFRALVESCGPVKTVVYKDRVGFMVRVRFAGAVPRSSWLDVGFWLPRRIEDPRMHRVETISPRAHVHVLRLTRPAQIDAQLKEWIAEACAVGRQEHLA
jgi:hypothetical protein